jgi:hypothetical protein
MPGPKDPIKNAEWRKKIGLSRMGKPTTKGPNTLEWKDKIRRTLTGRKATPETRLKQSLKRRGKDNPSWKGKVTIVCRNCGMSFETFPSRASTRKYCSMDCRNTDYGPRFFGKENPNWQNGASFEPYCEKFNRGFKTRVRAFFGYSCAICGRKQEDDIAGQSLHVHHINYKKDACCNPESIPLFITLCSHCHGKVHYDREYWNAHFQSIIEQKYEGKCYFTKEEYKRHLESCAR